MKKTIVIIGGVAVGASAAARLRRINEEDEIILLEKDEYISFANCGLPYFVGEVIENRDELIVQSKEGMKERYNIDVRNFSEAININRHDKTVTVENTKDKTTYDLKYDKLILAPGASPIVPNIPGLETAKNVFSLRTIPDADIIKSYIKENNIKHVSIVGAGFIGLEVAENLIHLGLDVLVMDLANQVMGVMDYEIANYIENEMRENGIDFKLETSIKEIKDNGKSLLLTDETTQNTDMIIMAIGVLPNTKLAQEAGLELGSTKAIKINEFNQTSDLDIYAGGDAIEVKHFVSKQPTKIPLAGPANRQARLIADHINGIHTPNRGSLGSSVIKIFDFTVASTGLTEKAAKQAGYNASSVHIQRANHASYYPGSSIITLKLVFDIETRRVLGAQAYGKSGTEKRIDVIATALKFNATVDDLAGLELTYAPPYSSAKDPVNIAGYVASNVLNKDYIPFYIESIPSLISSNAQIVDVRTKEEFDEGAIESAINVPLDELRDNLSKIDFNKDVYIYCAVGHRGYLSTKILKEYGFIKRIFNLSGGYNLYYEDIKNK